MQDNLYGRFERRTRKMKITIKRINQEEKDALVVNCPFFRIDSFVELIPDIFPDFEWIKIERDTEES